MSCAPRRFLNKLVLVRLKPDRGIDFRGILVRITSNSISVRLNGGGVTDVPCSFIQSVTLITNGCVSPDLLNRLVFVRLKPDRGVDFRGRLVRITRNSISVRLSDGGVTDVPCSFIRSVTPI
ncbi:hypothetical protein EDD57_13017 [Baia soyae]|uniref:Uncharacterized protein n=1 Tax=Baia soyae TaxID=1544746 RepID=A0A4R2RRI4_9BACL|nr:hypothetical protein EDD57_13017 [Baia soyae]